MCTVTTHRSRDQLIVTMNRDEQRTRHEAGLYLDGQHVYPVDGRSGGTWCGANSKGLVLTLLNRYQDEQQPGKTSRGSLIPAALALSSIKEIEDYLSALELRKRNPFTLWVMTLKETAEFVWDNGLLRSRTVKDHPWGFVSSSSLDMDNILARRRQRFEYWQGHNRVVAGKVPGIHLRRDNWDAAEAINMSRDLTHTKSISQISVGRQSLQFDYYSEEQVKQLEFDNSTLPTRRTRLRVSGQAVPEFAF